MKHVYCCFSLFLVASSVISVSRQTECTTTNEGTLKCKFSVNINATQRDFSIYFVPDHGGEEHLVGCSWIKSELHCITQKDFERKGLVTETAEIIIPRSFSSRNGSYRCVNDGYTLNATSCRFPARRDLEHSADYKANFTFDDSSALSRELTAVVCTIPLVLLTVVVVVPVVLLLKRKKGKEEKKGKMRGTLKRLLGNTGTEDLKLQHFQDGNPISA